MRLDVSLFARVVAVLEHAEEVKEACRGRYDNPDKGRYYCICRKGEICQIRLTELLHESKMTIAKFKRSEIMQQLQKAGVIHVRFAKNPPGKPSVFYSLNLDWKENLVGFIEAQAREFAETLLRTVKIERGEQQRRQLEKFEPELDPGLKELEELERKALEEVKHLVK
ncbi:hypothetical protein E3E31_11995 [Thermococcus sp. M39]|uniref:hypothetical protein n=1 Tax=Thermococcus sp. M39 TaxID=1638262 RepID=UPI00143897AF|nr:hypothetical protein [Thermococcus sp. M39]NJE09229.1 hypothetical protein [Thermococcus sp. M39]